MTRINVGIEVTELVREHLLEEHRGIRFIPLLIKSGELTNKNQPKRFTLDWGHDKFFYDKQLFLLNRYKAVRKECQNRGIRVCDFESAWDGIPEELMNDYVPNVRDKFLVQQRINKRLKLVL